jgi:CheY-like chemotaxis protein
VRDIALKLNVMYVDDDAVNLRVLADMLGACGMTVTCASSGAEALRIVEDQTFDVVLMDLHMPGLNGVETLNELRKNPRFDRSAPVVVVTADPSIEHDFAEMGFAGFLSKPVSMKPLLSAILAVLQPHERLAAPRPQAS